MTKLTYLGICTIAHDETKCRELLEQILWGDTPVCPHCGGMKNYKLVSKPTAKRQVRPGVRKCNECQRQFTVTVGTIFHGSHLPLGVWLQIFSLVCSSKKGMSALQISRMLNIKYKSAWFAVHRVRFALENVTGFKKLQGVIEIDEAFIGGKHKGALGRVPKPMKPVLALVERGGSVHSVPLEALNTKLIHDIIRAKVEKDSTVYTDEAPRYNNLKSKLFVQHKSVTHKHGEFARDVVSTNTVEGFFSLLKRGIIGTYHHVSQEHLGLYLSEFNFRYNSRKMEDEGRTILALKGIEGKRLMYKNHIRK